ncbi:RES family NAD+ phosphorylase [Chitinophaga rhizosphaerae]|uniref:RES family NAD+ phosphorylase n=1 Tax=Chitinophaga rhizosphaerae TaxID=1864947 RepID=UPI00196B60CD
MNPQDPHQPEQYDSPPDRFLGHGRLDSANFPVLYGSQDAEVCIHECRVSVEVEIYMATIEASKDLCFLDLTEILSEDGTEFESLDLAIHFLFLAAKHSYKISRDIAKVAKSAGYDGIIYPSYFSLVRTGAMPFETVLGISTRKLGEFKDRAQGHIIQNMAIFGRPIKDGKLHVRCINRAVLNRVFYGISFGPVQY